MKLTSKLVPAETYAIYFHSPKYEIEAIKMPNGKKWAVRANYGKGSMVNLQPQTSTTLYKTINGAGRTFGESKVEICYHTLSIPNRVKIVRINGRD